MDNNSYGNGDQNNYGRDYQGGDGYYHSAPRYTVEINRMASVAKVLGIITIVTTIFCTVYIPFITGSLAILFAILSKGKRKSLSSTAMTGVATAITGLILNILLIATVIYVYMTNPKIREEANNMMQQQYGFTIEDVIDRFTEKSE